MCESTNSSLCPRSSVFGSKDEWYFALIITTLSIIGLCGNILCIVVFTRGAMRLPGVHLLRYLSVTDFLTLALCYIDITFNGVRFDIDKARDLYKNIKPIVFPLNWTFRLFETNLTVLISLQRALAITKPLFLEKYLNSAIVNKILLCIGMISVLFSLPNWIVCGPQLYFTQEWNETLPSAESETLDRHLYSVIYLKYFILIVHCFIPILTLTICNISFIVARRHMAEVLGVSRDKGSDKMTAIVGAITTVAVVTHSVLAIQKISPDLPHINGIAGVFVVLKLSTNFIFYSVFGLTFRKTLMKMFRCKAQDDSQEQQITYSTTSL